MNDLELKLEEFMDILIHSYTITDRIEILKRLRKQMRPESWKIVYEVINNEKKLSSDEIRQRTIIKAEQDHERRMEAYRKESREIKIAREKELERTRIFYKHRKDEEKGIIEEPKKVPGKKIDRVETSEEFNERIRKEADSILAKQRE